MKSDRLINSAISILQILFYLCATIFVFLLLFAIVGKAIAILIGFGVAAIAKDAAQAVFTPRYSQPTKIADAAAAALAIVVFITVSYFGWQWLPEYSHSPLESTCQGRGCD